MGFDKTPVLAVNHGTITVGKHSKTKNILNNVTVSFSKGEFVCIVGGSGSGKSTLLKTLAGINVLTEGEVLLNGASVPREKLMSDPRIAYLPQDVVIHETLTPLAALTYIAKLKGVGNSSKKRREIIHSVLEQTGMTEHLRTPICRLSGGQRKRIALAAELIGDPQIILLDEVTSGLDPATDEEMMVLFRKLADSGKTVICITHNIGCLNLCTRILYVMKGNMIFSGSLNNCLAFFGVKSIKDAYEKQEIGTPDQWLHRFTSKCGQFPPVCPFQTYQDQQKAFTLGSAVRQTAILAKRYTHLQFADLKNCLFLFFQAPIIALLIGFPFGQLDGLNSYEKATRIKMISFMMILSMLWCASTASVREIVKEIPILTHEIRFGVRNTAYLLSKLIFLFFLVSIQTACLLFIVREITVLPPDSGFDVTKQFILLFLTGISGIMAGFFVSAHSKTTERAMTILPIVLIAEAVLSGALIKLESVAKWFSMLTVPAYWSMQGLIGTYPERLKSVKLDKPILGDGAEFILAVILLVVMSLIPFLLTRRRINCYFKAAKGFAVPSPTKLYRESGIPEKIASVSESLNSLEIKKKLSLLTSPESREKFLSLMDLPEMREKFSSLASPETKEKFLSSIIEKLEKIRDKK